MSRLLFWFKFSLLLLPQVLSAGDKNFSEYLQRVWRTEDGLPENTVNAIEQTPDGYLWLATFNGLARFDGTRFVTFDATNTPELKSSRIHQLHLDMQGQLWIISEFGHVTRVLNNRFTEFGPAQGLTHPATVMQEDAMGQLWADTHKEKFVFQNGRFVHGAYSNYLTVTSWPVPPGQSEPPASTNWNPNHAWFRPNYMARITVPPAPWELKTIGARDGGAWIVNQQVQKFRDGQWVRTIIPPQPLQSLGSLCEDSKGNLWVGTWEQGLFRFSTNGDFRRFTLVDSPTHWPVRKIFEDREGNIWIGSGGDGLWCFKTPFISNLSGHHGLQSEVVRSVAEDKDHRIWVCNLGGIEWLSRDAGGLAQASSLKIPIPGCLLSDRRGSVWITTYASGVYKYEKGLLSHYDLKDRPADGLPPALNVLYEDRDGLLHIGSSRGLYQLRGSHLEQVEKPLGEVPVDVRGIGEDNLGNFYLGLNGKGLMRRSNGHWNQFTQKSGLSSDHLWCLHIDSENTLWLGTVGKGLIRFQNGKIFNFTAPQLPLPRLITSILEDDSGFLWLGSHQGIYRVERGKLNAFADGRSTSLTTTQYGKNDGMGSSECVGSRQPSACKTRDGRLWFPTVKGLAVVDPKNLPFNSQPPSVVIEEVLVDGENRLARPETNLAPSRKSKEPGGSNQVAIAVSVPPRKGRIEIHYTGLSFASPEKVRFKYRLLGFDPDWVETGTRRFAHYTRVPPGDYQFQVTAANADGVWNEAGASLALHIAPAWWQTLWFRGAIPLSAALLLAAGYYHRVRGLKRMHLEQEEFSRRLIESQEQERQRIAAELHDGLGQSLLVIKSHAILAGRMINIETDTANRLKDLTEMAGQAISEVRSIAHHLRPFHLDQLGLTRAIRGMATQVTRSADLTLALDIADVDGAFSAETEINFFRMVQELLNNVIKHAHASTVKVMLTRSSDGVVLQVEDNGRGFEVVHRGAGFGLRNVAERVRITGGNWIIRSEPGKGTTVEIRLPVAVNHHGVTTAHE